jgi:hypothetical protein
MVCRSRVAGTTVSRNSGCHRAFTTCLEECHSCSKNHCSARGDRSRIALHLHSMDAKKLVRSSDIQNTYVCIDVCSLRISSSSVASSSARFMGDRYKSNSFSSRVGPSVAPVGHCPFHYWRCFQSHPNSNPKMDIDSLR